MIASPDLSNVCAALRWVLLGVVDGILQKAKPESTLEELAAPGFSSVTSLFYSKVKATVLVAKGVS